MRPSPLEVVPARYGRRAWDQALKPICQELGFRRGRVPVSGLPGWSKESDERSESFAFQIDPYGFDKFYGGRFVVQFSAVDNRRRTGLLERMWQLLDDVSRHEALRMNNRVIESLPGPSGDLLKSLPEPHRPCYLANFEPIAQVPLPDADVWFRYATADDADWWGHFVASRLRYVLSVCESRLANQPPGSSSGILGSLP